MKDIDIILTADRTIMNDMHKDWRICIPSWSSTDMMPYIGFNTWVPMSEHINGIPKYAPLSLRKLEAVLLNKGYSIKIVIPEYLSNYLPRAKCLGINSTDPCGKGFSPLYLQMYTKKNVRKLKFEDLINNKYIQKERDNGLKILVGGGGTWQFNEVPKQIDCIVDGEAERILPKLLDMVSNNNTLPRRISCEGDLVPDLTDIPIIKKPTQFGLLEIGRGCFRRCEFCTVSRKPYWIPLEVLKKEHQMIINSDLEHIQLLSEDVLLYGSKSLRSEPQKFNSMISSMSDGIKFLTFTHFSISALNDSPSLFQSIHEHLPDGQDFTIAQTGIETGSERLLNIICPTKKHPIKGKSWKDMVINAVNILEDSIVFPYYTILLGCEHQTRNDAVLTLELLEEIDHSKSVFMPCLYTLKNKPQPKVFELMDTEKEIVKLCSNHNMKWYNELTHMVIDLYPSKRKLRKIIQKVLYYYLKNKFENIIEKL
jgi:radical SAM superfamily enzyme YgiQ (UPF0313 family)